MQFWILLLLCLVAGLLGTSSSKRSLEAPSSTSPAGREEELLQPCERDLPQSAAACFQLGKAHLDKNELVAARSYYKKALPLFRVQEDRRAEAKTLDGLGRTYFRQGELREAFNLYHKALPLFRQIGDLAGEADSLSNIALIHKMWGETQDALNLFRQALERQRDLGGESAQGAILYNLGETYLALGRPQEALQSFQDAIPLLRRAGKRTGRALSGAGEAYSKLSLIRSAHFRFRQAIERLRRDGDFAALVIVLSREGDLQLRERQYTEALDLFEEALSVSRAAQDPRSEAVALAGIARYFDLVGRDAEALRCFTDARRLFERAGERDSIAATLYRSAQALRDLGRLSEARSAIEESLAITESLRVEPVRVGLRSSYLANVRERYQFYIDFLMQLHRNDPKRGFDIRAFEVSERARARMLLDEVSEARADLHGNVDADLIERKKDLLRRLREAEKKRADLVFSQPAPKNLRDLSEIDKDIEDLGARYDATLAEIREKNPRYAALTQPQPLSLAEIRRGILDPDTLLIVYSLGEPYSFVWLIRKDSLEARELASGRRIEGVTVKLAEALARGGQRGAQEQVRNAAEALSRLLLEPIAEELTEERLLIVVEGALLGVPFIMLPDPRIGSADWSSGSLLANHEVTMLPSVSAIGTLRRQLRGRRPAPLKVAVLADPVFEVDDARVRLSSPRQSSADGVGEGLLPDGLKRLVHTREEAEAIRELVPPGQGLFLIGFEADLQAATGPELREYQIVHFATHGIFSSNPDRSGIVLSTIDEQGRRQNGFLRAADVYALNLPAELVVLSACRTAQGEEVKGDGLGLLTRGFLYAGARRVVVSLWDVDDAATAELMKSFYRGMFEDGLSPAAALRAAQLSVSRKKRWQAPYYWAGFVLQGDW